MSKGFSLVELLLVIAIVGFTALLIANLPSSVASINKSRHSSIAREVLNKEMDFLRNKTYANLADGTVSFTDSSLNELRTPSATYEISDCPAQICTNSEKIKQVKATISWNEGGVNETVELTTFIGEKGLAQ